MIILYTFIIAVFLSSAILPLIIRFALNRDLVDVPDERKVHHGQIPRIGGIAIAIGAAIPILIWLPVDRQSVSILAGALIVHTFGVVDDVRGLSYRYKFLGQLIAVSVVVFGGDVVVRNYPFIGNDVLPEAFNIGFTLFALIGITNAINLSDGLDGLAGGASLMSFAVIAILSFMAGNYVLTLMAAAISGGIMGFLRYNTHPAQIFMGDGGSQLLGYLLGCLVIVLTQTVNPALSPVIALLLLGMPVLDTITVMARRIYDGRSPFSPDMAHIHHKLLNFGLSHNGVVFTVYLVQSSMVLSAYLFRYYSDVFLMALYLSMCVGILVFFRLANRYHWKLATGGTKTESEKKYRERKKFNYSPAMLIKFSILLFLGYGVYIHSTGSDWLRASWIVLFLLMAAALKMKSRARTVVIRVGYYVIGVYFLYVIDSLEGHLNVDNTIHGFIVLLAVLTAIGIKVTDKTRFSITTLDYLIILSIILIPNLPVKEVAGRHIGIFALHVMAFFYALEYMFSAMTRKKDFTPFPILLVTALLAIK